MIGIIKNLSKNLRADSRQRRINEESFFEESSLKLLDNFLPTEYLLLYSIIITYKYYISIYIYRVLIYSWIVDFKDKHKSFYKIFIEAYLGYTIEYKLFIFIYIYFFIYFILTIRINPSKISHEYI